jgi:hypothetical protein
MFLYEGRTYIEGILGWYDEENIQTEIKEAYRNGEYHGILNSIILFFFNIRALVSKSVRWVK